MKPVHYLAIGLVLLTACSGGGSGASSPKAGSGSTPKSLAAPHPVSVTVTLDSSKAATAPIPTKGGTVSATGSDGTVFTLTIPDGALEGTEKVTLTPVQQIGGLPFSGGLRAAVQMAPDGLQLFQPATHDQARESGACRPTAGRVRLSRQWNRVLHVPGYRRRRAHVQDQPFLRRGRRVRHQG